MVGFVAALAAVLGTLGAGLAVSFRALLMLNLYTQNADATYRQELRLQRVK